MSPNEWINELKELTEIEYAKAEDNAKALVRKKLGEQPTLEQFRNRVGGQFDVIVVLMVVAFIGAVVVSAFDIAKFVGRQVFLHNDLTSYVGIHIDVYWMAVLFQISFLLLAEFSVILFLIRWRQQIKTTEWEGLQLGRWYVNKSVVKFFGQFINVYFVLAVSSISFVFYANWQSGVHWLLAILPPVVTLGVGWVFEELITDWLSQYEKDERQYLEASQHWLIINREPESDKQYKEYLMRSIWGALRSKNQRYDIQLDVSGDWKIQAVNRELDKAEWAKQALVKKAFVYEHPEVSQDKISTMSNLELLRQKMDSWSVKDGLIEIGEYIVDMKKITIRNTITNEVVTSKTTQGLKHKVSSMIRERKNA